jgi:hypothetical protein
MDNVLVSEGAVAPLLLRETANLLHLRQVKARA